VTCGEAAISSKIFEQETTMTFKKLISRFARDEKGVTAIEYGLIAALIAVVIIGAVTTVGTDLSATFGDVSAALEGTTTTTPPTTP